MGAKRILIAGGGTGGHLIPGLAVARELQQREPERPVEFVGSRYGIEARMVPAAGFPLEALGLRGLKGKGIFAKLGAVCAAVWGVTRCVVSMLQRRPELVIGVGGYASGPAVLAAVMLRVKTMLLEQNHFPGATNRSMARWVDALCVPSEAARKRFDGLGVVTGNPVRPEFNTIGPVDTQTAPGAPVRVLVFGGSRGARSINEAMMRCAAALAASPNPPQLRIQTGEADLARVRAAYADYPADRVQIDAFIDAMDQELAHAQLVVCRAGATTLAELAAAGRPAVLVPYPYAADDHQRHNAEAVAEVGGAHVMLDAALEGDALAPVILDYSSDLERLARMGQAAKQLAFPKALDQIVTIAEDLIAGRKGAA